MGTSQSASSTWPLAPSPYYKNDFVMHYLNINEGSLKIQPPRKMFEDFQRQTFLFTEVVTINRLTKYTYRGGHFIYGVGQNCLPR
jgi:hypothetical protein